MFEGNPDEENAPVVADLGRPIHCAACLTRITSAESRTERGGAHAHTFENPAGITFQIGCFSSAPGCVVQGEPTLEYTWFPGYAWSYASCANCREHLGWRWDGDADRFFGLILARLA
jgi:hypothetical protein